MYLTPRHRLNGNVNDIGTIFTHFKNRSHRKTRSCMTMVLDNDFRMFIFDSLHQLTQECRTSDTCHVLQADFRSTRFDELVCNVCIIFYRMTRRESNTKSSLRNHATFLSILDGRNDIAYVVQTTENTSDINSLLIFHFIHQLTYIGRNRIHTQAVQATVEHVGLNTRFMQWLGKCTDCLVRIFAI